MKVVFMGTPDFAVPVLEALVADGQQVSLVVTQPDRVKGRGREVAMSPVKQCALVHDIPVFQPQRVKTPEAVERLRQEQPDIIIVAAYGQILSTEILTMPKYGCVNVHASLLPKYRGAAPIQWAVINGEKKSGVTIMQMDAGLDTGDIILQEEIELDPKETGESLYEKLSAMGGPLLLKAMKQIEEGTATREKQSDAVSTYARILKREMGLIRWDSSAVSIERLIRGMNSWPSAFTHFHGKLLKIWDADVVLKKASGTPGMITGSDKEAIYVNTGDQILALKEVQLEGKKRMPVKDFLLGCDIKDGEILN